MALFMVATPIGNPQDLSARARALLAEADLVIGEELKELRQTLKAAGVQARAMDQLNEHSREADIEHFVNEARVKKVVVVSDCGTPGFCDPGADLVKAARRAGVSVHAVPGASSLMALLSVCGVRVDRFTFAGFLPPKTDARDSEWRALLKEPRATVVMETPYRCEKLIEEIKTKAADRFCVIGLNLTQENEKVLSGYGRDLEFKGDAEPIALIMPQGFRA
jgi:16S rRNA (cytidine1402-2'-O)-methyltransferase